MLCTKCKINTATFFYTQNINGKESSVALCNNCATADGLGDTVAPIFSSLFETPTKKRVTNTQNTKRCTLCALTFSDILSLGKVGCPECYNTFKAELSNTIRSVHGNAKHTGLTPNTEAEATVSEEEMLKIELKEAISAENYELAATLRDKIKSLKGEL